MNKRDPNNFTATHFIPFIPIKKRTFSSVKARFGQQVLIDIKELLLSDKPRRAKKRLLYEGFPELYDNLKDIFWEAYINMLLGGEDETIE